jgi:hypothetical protein
MIEAKFSCGCGAIQGKIGAKKEDSMQLHCYCNDCRDFTAAIAAKGAKTIESTAECRLVLVGKNALTIDQGTENIKLARKAGDKGMFRYYAGCCNVPLWNTGDSIGFVGVYDNILSERKEEFDGPYGFGEDEPGKLTITDPVPILTGAKFMEHLGRYGPHVESGPFDYSLPPVYWDEEEKESN